MFSIILPKNTWSLKSNFPKKSSPSGRNLAWRFFRLHSSSLAQGCRIAPTLSVLSVTPRSHLLWVTHSVLFLSKSRACPRCLDGSDRLRSQDPPRPGPTEALGKSLLSFGLPGTAGMGEDGAVLGTLPSPRSCCRYHGQGPGSGWSSLTSTPGQGFHLPLKQQSPRTSMTVPPSDHPFPAASTWHFHGRCHLKPHTSCTKPSTLLCVSFLQIKSLQLQRL